MLDNPPRRPSAWRYIIVAARPVHVGRVSALDGVVVRGLRGLVRGGVGVAGLPHVVRLELAGLALYVVLTRAHGGVRSFGRGSLIAKKV